VGRGRGRDPIEGWVEGGEVGRDEDHQFIVVVEGIFFNFHNLEIVHPFHHPLYQNTL